MLNDFQSIPSKLNQLLDRRRKLFLIILVLMAIVLSIVETAGVSIVMPFISAASNPEIVQTEYYGYFYNLFGFTNTVQFILTFGIAIIVFYFFRSIYNIFYSYTLNKFSLGTFRYFAAKLFKTYLAIPYRVFVQKNPSVMSQMIITEANYLSNLLLNFLQVFTEAITILLLYILMLAVNWQITIVLTGTLIIIMLVVFNTIIKTSKKLGKKRFEANTNLSKIIWATLNNFKFIKLKGNQDELFTTFMDSTSKMSRTTIISSTLGGVPKNILENMGFSLLIAAVCYILWQYKSAEMVIPVISMYALALYRMLPAVTRILGYFNAIAFQQNSLYRIFDELKLETIEEGSDSVEFKNSIRAENLSFRYADGGNIINNASFEIQCGEKIAVTGESGSGKTTLIDIIIGIHKPQRGDIYIDGVIINDSNIRSWRSKIGYIPQEIFLFDGTVAENVAFGSKHDDEKIITVLQKAKIYDFLQTKDGIRTLVGDRGIQLSGGQKQRIGIARALYSDPEVLVLDEATSSLDDATEAGIMNEIYDVSGNKTLIVIAHRLSTVERCDRRIRIEDGILTA